MIAVRGAEIAALGDGVTRWHVGDAVVALTHGGGYAEYVAVPAGQVLQPKFAIGEYGFIAIAQDTEGNVIGLHSVQ